MILTIGRNASPIHAASLLLLLAALLLDLPDKAVGSRPPAVAGDKSGSAPSLLRLATLPAGAEVTGLFLGGAGELFFNVQHPSPTNRPPFDRALVGYIAGLDFRRLPPDLPAVPVPKGPVKRKKVQVAAGEYRILARAGDTLGGALPDGLGAILAAAGHVVIKRCNNPDFNGLILAGEGRGHLFTSWEDRPGGMSRLPLIRDGGQWTVDPEGARMLDFSGVKGTWVNCFGTVSPWGTPLAAEESYASERVAAWNDPDPDAAYWRRGVNDLAAYLGLGDPRKSWPNPYRYGYILEITDPAGAAVTRKRFALGRFAHENAVVMPDRRTVYLSDDGGGTALFKFVADRASDLSAGTLYAARLTQDSGKTDPAVAGFDVAWVRLARATEDAIAGWIARFDSVTQADFIPGENSYITSAEIAAWADYRQRNGKTFPGIDVDDDGRIGDGDIRDPRAVAFLEARRAAAAAGATAEFRKMEGVNIHPQGARDGSVPYLYLAVSRVGGPMSDGRGDIRLTGSPCGVVYRLPLGAGFEVERLEPVVAGDYTPSGTAPCSADTLANPDNLVVLPDGRVVVGEDTGYHRNNAVWLLDPGNGQD